MSQNISIDNQDFQLVYPNSKFSKKSKIVRENKILKTQEENSVFQPCFEEIESAFYGKIFKKKMCHSVYKTEKTRKSKRCDPSAIYMIIQCEKDKNDKTKFTMNHLYTLGLFNTMISECIEKIKVNFKMKQRDKITKDLLITFKDVAYDKNIASVHLAVADSCSAIFEAKKANVFMIDHNDEGFMYAVTSIGKDPGGTRFIKTYTKYPTNCGYTGHCAQNKQIVIYQDGVKLYQKGKEIEVEFISEIDNFVLESDVRNAIYGP